jgi:hypothetical protein
MAIVVGTIIAFEGEGEVKAKVEVEGGAYRLKF